MENNRLTGSTVINPVNILVEHYQAITPQSTVKEFKKSTMTLLEKLKNNEEYKDSELLNEE